MSWATSYIKKLQNGESVCFRPKGNSMVPLIKSGDLVEIEPILESHEFKIGDIVLCKVKGKQYLHLIKSIQENRILIGNNRGYINGWTSKNSIYGLCVKIGE